MDEFDELDGLLALEEELAMEQLASEHPSTSSSLTSTPAAVMTTPDPKPAEVKPKKLSFIDLMMAKSNMEPKPSTSAPKTSAVHSGDTDSEDDDEVRNFLDRKFNEYGANINKKLKQQSEEVRDRQISAEVGKSIGKSSCGQLTNNFASKPNKLSNQPKPSIIEQKSTAKQQMLNNPAMAYNVYRDPVFGLRMVKPLISSAVLVERMEGRTNISLKQIRTHTDHGDLTRDWVVAGVVISKSPTRTSKKGTQYIVWKVSDLRGEIRSVSVFLFKAAFKDLWKTAVGTCIGILNPSVMDRKDEKNDEAVLSVDNPQKVMILGHSKDFGTCRSKKKNGEPCTAVVNLEECEYCIYHIKSEYSNASKRTELLSATAGRGLNELRNKVLGKNEVFYAGNVYSAVPAKKNPKLVAKDRQRIASLAEHMETSVPAGLPSYRAQPVLPKRKEIFTDLASGRKFTAPSLEVSAKQREQDVKRLKLLRGGDTTTEASANTSSPIVAKKPELVFSTTPRLSQSSFTIDLNISGRQMNAAKQKALEILKKKPLEKSNPNFIKYRGTEAGKKRAFDELGLADEKDDPKRAKTDATDAEKARQERILKIMNEKSSHSDLVEAHENQHQEKYFRNLEKKEAMEEKMLNTFKMDCRVVICLQCKYKAFSAADRCKQEKHPLKVVDGEKRFFKCGDCGNRTVSLDKIPKNSCSNCQSSKWEKSTMIREKKGILVGEQLSIRGDEEQYIGSLSTANVNLLVPDAGT